jgi:outer membrane protein assembly factor BamA
VETEAYIPIELPRGSVEFTRKNMRGLGETASISARFSRLDQRGALSYTQPHFMSSAWNSSSIFEKRFEYQGNCR